MTIPNFIVFVDDINTPAHRNSNIANFSAKKKENPTSPCRKKQRLNEIEQETQGKSGNNCDSKRPERRGRRPKLVRQLGTKDLSKQLKLPRGNNLNCIDDDDDFTLGNSTIRSTNTDDDFDSKVNVAGIISYENKSAKFSVSPKLNKGLKKPRRMRSIDEDCRAQVVIEDSPFQLLTRPSTSHALKVKKQSLLMPKRRPSTKNSGNSSERLLMSLPSMLEVL